MRMKIDSVLELHQKRTKGIFVRLNDAERGAIERIAKEEDVTISELVRAMIQGLLTKKGAVR